MGDPKIFGENKRNSLSIKTLFPESVIIEFFRFVNKIEETDIEYNPTMVVDIDRYIDNNSSRWIYSPILKNNADSRYIVFLIHYYDRNPGMQLEINSKLSESTIIQVETLKKSFKLGC